MPKEFLSGCPQCGYFTKGIEPPGRKKSNGFILSKKKKSSIEFPLWFYKVAALVVTLLLISIIIWYITSLL
ncbi:MAG: hypothetical protein JXJ04_08105 [Spirochaetales bacterium]|nr:hypothetical protein [Spirochaetales bacterium]